MNEPSHLTDYNEPLCRRVYGGFRVAANGTSLPVLVTHRQQFLASARRRDLFLKILEEVRRKFDFVVWGYVVMPEHFHLLISEPKTVSVALAIQVLKQRKLVASPELWRWHKK